MSAHVSSDILHLGLGYVSVMSVNSSKIRNQIGDKHFTSKASKDHPIGIIPCNSLQERNTLVIVKPS